MKEQDIELKSEKARTLIDSTLPFYTRYGIVIVSLIIFLMAFAFGRIGISEKGSFLVKIAPNKEIGYITIPIDADLPKNLEYVEIKVAHSNIMCKIIKVEEKENSKCLHIDLANVKSLHKKNYQYGIYAEFTIYRYTFMDCLNPFAR